MQEKTKKQRALGLEKLKHKPKRNLRRNLRVGDDDEDEEDEEELSLPELELIDDIFSDNEPLVHKMQMLCLLKSKRRERKGLQYIS